jgi:hypothetical protein
MPNEKIVDLPEDTTPAATDFVTTIDVSDTTDSPEGSSKKVQIGNLGTASVPDGSITNAKLADMAQATIKGRAAGAGTGDPTDLTATQATAILNAVVGDSGSGGTKGLVPAPAAGDAAAGRFLKADGTFAVPPSGSGDVVGPASATDNAVARYNTTTGKLIQDSNLTLPDDAAATEVGYLNIPQNSQSADYTAVIADRAKHLFHPVGDNNARTFTIPANGSVPFALGTAITFVNKINVLSIAITTDTLTWAEDGTTGTRSLAANGIATALKITTTEWLISGTGLS